jgi:hypothetical protein
LRWLLTCLGTLFDARAILTMRAWGPAQMLTGPNMAISGSVTAPLLYSGRAMYWQSKYCHISCLVPVQPVVGQEMSRAQRKNHPRGCVQSWAPGSALRNADKPGASSQKSRKCIMSSARFNSSARVRCGMRGTLVVGYATLLHKLAVGQASKRHRESGEESSENT